MSYQLSFADRFYTRAEDMPPSNPASPHCGDVSFRPLGSGINDLILQITAEEMKILLSCATQGAELLYPDRAQDIFEILLRAIDCTPDDLEQSGCTEYMPSAPFLTYFPDNPYLAGDGSAGWNKEAWYQWGAFDTLFPDWIDNWLNGAISAITGYQATDVLFNIESIPINPIDAWLSGGGILPKIEIRFSGTGVIELGLLSFPLGGKAIIELDNEPNALDILTGGVLDPASFLVELERDIVNFPPDEYPINTIEIPVTTGGLHTLYIVFIPILDDALLPIGFGGGLRSIEMCGFEELPVAGIEAVIFEDCTLKTVINGVKTPVLGWENWLACIEHPEGGGGGGGAIGVKASVYSFELPAAQDTTSTTLVEAAGSNQAHTFTYPNALVIAQGQFQNTGGANIAFEVRVNDVASSPQRLNRMGGNGGEVLHHTGTFEGLTTGVSSQLSMWFRAQPNGTARIGQGTQMRYTILEFADAADLQGVEDVRYQDGVLQKKLAGVWIDVVDIDALLAPIEASAASAQATASSALTAASAAQTTANNAATVNASQTAQINSIISLNTTQNSRLTALESDMADVELSIGQHNITLADHESRLDALEAASGGLAEYWSKEWDFLGSNQGFSSTGGTWVSGQGWVGSGSIRLQLASPNINDSRITRMQVYVRKMSGGFGTCTVEWADVSGFSVFRMSGGTLLNIVWSQVGNYQASPSTVNVLFSNFSGELRIEKLRLLGHGQHFFP